MKVFLDDERVTPTGWYRTFTVEETIDVLKTRRVLELSLDNDLGEGLPEGFRVLDWLEEEVNNDPSFPIPIIAVHSSNASRAQSMRQTAHKLEYIRQQQVGGH